MSDSYFDERALKLMAASKEREEALQETVTGIRGKMMKALRYPMDWDNDKFPTVMHALEEVARVYHENKTENPDAGSSPVR